jgi:hypothetical protein
LTLTVRFTWEGGAVRDEGSNQVQASVTQDSAFLLIDILDLEGRPLMATTRVDRDAQSPTQTVVIDQVPVGTHLLRIEAYDAQNQLVGSVEGEVTIQAGQVVQVTVTLSPKGSPSPSPSPSPSGSPSPSPSPTPTVPPGNPFQLSDTADGPESKLEVALDSAGQLVAAWLGTGGVRLRAFTAPPNPAGKFNARTLPPSGFGASVDNPAIAVDDAGRVAVSWTNSSFSNNVLAAGFDQDTGTVLWSPSTTLVDSTNSNLATSDLGIFGSTVLVGYQGPGAQLSYLPLDVTTGVAQGTSTQVSATFSFLGNPRARLRLDSSGNQIYSYVVQTTPAPGDLYRIYLQIVSSGGAVGSAFDVDVSDTVDGTGRPGLAVGGGRIVVTWQATDREVYLRRFAYDPGNPGAGVRVLDATRVKVADTTPGGLQAPDVAADSSGNFVVVWADSGDILGRSFLADGTPGAVFQVPVLAVGDTASAPRIAMTPAGAFVVGYLLDSGGAVMGFARDFPAGYGKP